MNDPAASSGVSSCLLGRPSVLDAESSRVFWIPAFAGMTNSRQAAGNEPHRIQREEEWGGGLLDASPTGKEGTAPHRTIPSVNSRA